MVVIPLQCGDVNSICQYVPEKSGALAGLLTRKVKLVVRCQDVFDLHLESVQNFVTVYLHSQIEVVDAKSGKSLGTLQDVSIFTEIASFHQIRGGSKFWRSNMLIAPAILVEVVSALSYTIKVFSRLRSHSTNSMFERQNLDSPRIASAGIQSDIGDPRTKFGLRSWKTRASNERKYLCSFQ